MRAGHDDDHAITERRADEGETDAGIPRGAFDDRSARPQLSGGFCIAHDSEGRTVFHGLAGIQELTFAKDLTAGLLRDLVQAEERRVSDKLDNGSIGLHTGGFQVGFRVEPGS